MQCTVFNDHYLLKLTNSLLMIPLKPISSVYLIHMSSIESLNKICLILTFLRFMIYNIDDIKNGGSLFGEED